MNGKEMIFKACRGDDLLGMPPLNGEIHRGMQAYV